MKFIIYCRKSTDSEDRQVLSLESQENELKRLAETNDLKIVSIFRESMSAKEPGRPVFNDMMKMILSGKADAILCWKIDRLTRNPVDGGQIQWLLQTNKINCIRTFEKSFYPNDNVLLMSIEQAMASQYIRDLSVNVKRGNREKLARGEWPNHAPFGYLNDKANKTIVVDRANSKYVSRVYDLYVNNHKNFKEISSFLHNEGLRTKSGGKVMKSHIQRILSNPFYSGIMLREGKYYQGNHEPLIPKSVFDQAQEIMQGKLHPKSKRLFFPLRGFLSCDNCGCSLTSSLKKGHQYYYCTNGKGSCEEHKSYLRENQLYGVVANILANIDFTEPKIEKMYQAAKEKSDFESGYIIQNLKTLETQLESLKTKESRLLDTFLAEQIPKDLYDQKTLELQNEKFSLEKRIKEFKIQQPAFTLEPIKSMFLEASRAKVAFLNGDDYKKRKVIENFVWNLSLKNKSVAQMKLVGPYEVMFKAPKNGSMRELLGVWDSTRAFIELGRCREGDITLDQGIR